MTKAKWFTSALLIGLLFGAAAVWAQAPQAQPDPKNPPRFGFEFKVALVDSKAISGSVSAGKYIAEVQIKDLTSGKMAAQPKIEQELGKDGKTMAEVKELGLTVDFSTQIAADLKTIKCSAKLLMGNVLYGSSSTVILLAPGAGK